MRLPTTSARPRGLLLLLGLVACDVSPHGLDPELPPGVGSGQTGSPQSGGYECLEDDTCQETAEARAAELASPSVLLRSFSSARCEHVGLIGGADSRSGPTCVCNLGDGGSINVGPAGATCQVRGRAGDCLWERFDGCDMFDASSCNTVCSELEQRFASDAARTHAVEVAYFDCARHSCRSVLSIDGRCVPATAVSSGKSYDCALGGKAILEQDEQEQSSGMSPPDEVVSRPQPYVPGTRGFVQLGVQSDAWGAGEGTPSVYAMAQFCETDGESSYRGEVLDPLEGSDDCGVVRGGQWSGSGQRFFQVTEAKLELSGQSFVFETAPGSSADFASYFAPETLSAAGPHYGATYRFSAHGGGLSAPLELTVRLPEALSVPTLASASRLPLEALRLRWSGRGAAPLRLSLSVIPALADVMYPVEVECLMKDDGEFVIPAEVLAKAGSGIATARFTRDARSVETSGAQRLLSWGMVEATYHLALGEPCARDEVLAACKRFAAHQAEAYRACGVSPVPSLESTCPAYLAESCAGCVEIFECRQKALSCGADGLVSSAPCSCPVSARAPEGALRPR